MAGLWVSKGYALPLNDANIANKNNVLPALADPAFDPGRAHTLPWQCGFAGLGCNKALLKEATGKDRMKSLDDLWDPALKGKITVLDEMRDTIGIIMMAQGKDPSNFTDDDFNAAADELQKQLDSGQIRQVTGNDYLTALENKDVVAVIGWSGDVAALGDDYEFALPESGGTLWTDNMLIPAMAAPPEERREGHELLLRPGDRGGGGGVRPVHHPGERRPGGDREDRPQPRREPAHLPDGGDAVEGEDLHAAHPAQQTQYEQPFQQLIGN